MEIQDSDSDFLVSGLDRNVKGVQEHFQVTPNRLGRRMDGEGSDCRRCGRQDGVAGTDVSQDELLMTPLNPFCLIE
ncbi:hypothetical protein [Deinococcus sp. UYEF24]